MKGKINIWIADKPQWSDMTTPYQNEAVTIAQSSLISLLSNVRLDNCDSDPKILFSNCTVIPCIKETSFLNLAIVFKQYVILNIHFY